MKIYTIKQLIPGALIKPELKGKTLVACRSDRNFTHVKFQNKLMKIPADMLCTLQQQDNYGRDPYFLNYYEWKPADNMWDAV